MNYQMAIKYTKLPLNIPNGLEIYISRSKAFLNIPELEVLV
jgi:hypothetical protein